MIIIFAICLSVWKVIFSRVDFFLNPRLWKALLHSIDVKYADILIHPYDVVVLF